MEKIKKVLITGISGFVGSHLAEYYLNNSDLEVYGLIRHRSSKELLKDIIDKITFVEGDINDTHSINEVIQKVQPDYLHHLAAQSYVPSSWVRPGETFQTNSVGSLNILESIRHYSPHTVVHFCSTSEVYGNQTKLPIDELNPTNPASPYAVSKLAMEYLASQYHKSYEIKSVITRAFNHGGPRRGEVFIESKIAKAVCLHKVGKLDKLELGALDNKRDWTDVRDIVKAYFLSVKYCKHGEVYNISSGVTRTIRSIIDIMSKYLGVNGSFKVEQSSKFMRPSDISVLLGDSTKFRNITGWEPVISWEKTCEDLVDYWKERV